MVARTIGAAVRALHRFGEEITEISLDHDISHQVGMGELSRPYPCGETFQPVCHYIGLLHLAGTFSIAGIATEYTPKITLHTSNPVGGEEMARILQDYGLSCTKKYMGIANRLEMEI